MLFLAVLALATAGAALGRRTVRTTARWGMGVALAIAGATHLAMPTPFEQHLPDWVPAATALVVITGLIEIAIGVALLVAPGPPAGARRAWGRIGAAYLVAVFPANVYVAVAGVDVEGQPGGAYPWLRLPLQALFVAWMLWSTAEPRHPTVPGSADPALPRLELPWARGPQAHEPGDRVVMASRLELRRWRDVPAFLVAALRLRSLFRRSPGAVALSLRAAPIGRTFWTLSVWDGRGSLGAYAGDQLHVSVMRRFRAAMKGSTFTDWDATGPDLPTWSEARQRIGAAQRGTNLDVQAMKGARCGSPS